VAHGRVKVGPSVLAAIGQREECRREDGGESKGFLGGALLPGGGIVIEYACTCGGTVAE